VKTSRGRSYVSAVPQTKAEGRRAPLARASKARAVFGRDGTSEARVLRLALQLVEVAVAVEAERSNPSPAAHDARRRAERRARDLRCVLVRSGGREAVGELQRALASDGGALLRAVARSAPGVREHLVRAAVTYANVAREHAVTSSSGLAVLARSARWSALSDALLDAVTGAGLGAESERWMKLAQLASASARLDLLTSLQLGKAADEARRTSAPTLTEADLRRREASMRARHEQEARSRGLEVDLKPDEPTSDEPTGKPDELADELTKGPPS
jgi:hypothetical protein